MNTLVYTDQEITAIYNRHVDTVYRLCFSFMKNRPETEDMVQETFLKLIATNKQFENPEHEKAWLIVTASNLCKDSLKRWWRKRECSAEELVLPAPEQTEGQNMLQALLQLPRDYKTVVYMYYYEDYTTAEIASILHIPNSTVRSRLARARARLKGIIGGCE